MTHFKLHSYLATSLFSGCCLWFAACSETSDPPVEITDPIEVPSDDGKIVIEIPAGGFQIPRCKVLSIRSCSDRRRNLRNAMEHRRFRYLFSKRAGIYSTQSGTVFYHIASYKQRTKKEYTGLYCHRKARRKKLLSLYHFHTGI